MLTFLLLLFHFKATGVIAAAAAPAVADARYSDVYNKKAGFLNSEARRTLDSPVFGTAPYTVRLPTDTVVKRIVIKLSLNSTVTYASGSPIFGHQGFMDRIITTVECNIGGGRVIKSVRPQMARLVSMLVNHNIPRRIYNFKSTAQTSTRGSREWLCGTLAYPATTYYVQAQEVMELQFQNVLGYGGSRYMTELDIRNVSSANLTFRFAALSNIQADGSSAAVTYATTPTVNIVPIMVENRARVMPAPGQIMYDYVETYTSDQAAAAGGRVVNILSGNFLMALSLYSQNGDASLTPADNLLTQLAVKINGATSMVGPLSFQDLQDDNLLRFGARDDFGLADYNATIASTADVHPLLGFAHINLLRNGNWNTALNLSQGNGVSAATLEYTAPLSTGTDAGTYTNPLQLTIHKHELRPFAYTA